jgi:LysR family cys regulon transcriptional activator
MDIRQLQSLIKLIDYPMITCVYGFTGRGHFSETFRAAGLVPQVVLSVADTDIVRTYVLEEMGIGIITSMALDEPANGATCNRDVSHPFPWEVTRIADLNDKHLRHYEQTFIDLFLDLVAKSDDGKIHRI